MKKDSKKEFKTKVSRNRKKITKGLPTTSRKFGYDAWTESRQTDTKNPNGAKISRPKNTKGKLLN
ncbi:MAG: hypothetical protein AAB824_02650 [Patescibacteria group bacterium]